MSLENTGATVSPVRRLIVNADDFGQTAGINDGIIRCFEDGVLTSASLMVRGQAAAAAAAYARSAPRLSVGLHIDLGEWVYRESEWLPLYTVVASADPRAVEAEIRRQLDMFRQLMGIDPTHLDSHQHVHRSGPARRVAAALGADLRIPVRDATASVRYDGSFYGQSAKGEAAHDCIGVQRLIEVLQALPLGTTEIGCHPGMRADAPGMYGVEREREVEVLCDPRVRATIDDEQVELISYRDVISPSSPPAARAASRGR